MAIDNLAPQKTTLRAMNLQQLQAYAAANKDNPYAVLAALDMANKKKAFLQAAQGAGAGPQPKVVDEAISQIAPSDVPRDVMQRYETVPMVNPDRVARLPNETGIGSLSAENLRSMKEGGKTRSTKANEDEEYGYWENMMGGPAQMAPGFEENMLAGPPALMPGYVYDPVNNRGVLENMLGGPPELPEDSGIGVLPARSLENFAEGGIVAFDKGGTAKAKLPQDLQDYIVAQARANGVDPQVALAIASAESGGKLNEKNPASSARGVFQILDKTYKDAGGDPSKRNDPFENARVGTLLLGQNAAGLRKMLGRDPTPGELYTTHFLGGPTGRQLLKADADVPVADFLDKADPKLANEIINSNKEVMHGKTVGQVRDWADKTIARKLTDLLPMGSAVAADKVSSKGLPDLVAPKAAAPAPAPAPTAIDPNAPWYDRYRQALTSGEGQRQMMLGVGDLPYNLLGLPMDIGYSTAKAFGFKGAEPALGSRHLKDLATRYLGREADPTDPTLQGTRLAGELGGALIDPLAFTSKAAKVADTGLQALADAKAAKLAEAQAAQKVERLTPPAQAIPGLTPEAQAIRDTAIETRRLRQQAADRAAMQPGITQLETEASQAARAAEAARAPEAAPAISPQTLERARAGQVASGVYPAAGGVSALVQPPATQMSFDDRAPGEGNEKLDQSGDITAPLIDKLKGEAETGKKASGFDLNDFLMYMGFGLMAGKSPHALTNVGEAGLGALKMMTEQEKARSEAAYREAEAKKALMPTGEVQFMDWMRQPENFALYQRVQSAKQDPRLITQLAGEAVKNPAMLEVLQKIDPVMHSMIRNEIIGSHAPSVIKTPGKDALVRDR